MQHLNTYADERLAAFCVHCGARPDTRDHAPSKVLLDEPYPPNLPVLGACASCNASFSEDEVYVACLIECVLVGSAQPEDMRRDKVRRILLEQPRLRERLANAREQNLLTTRFHVEHDRVRRVLLKLARCHAAFENAEPQLDEPSSIIFLPLDCTSSDERAGFERPPTTTAWPEVGSRALRRVLLSPAGRSPWLDVQEGRYRYLVAVANGIVVRIVLSEYLGCEVVWS